MKQLIHQYQNLSGFQFFYYEEITKHLKMNEIFEKVEKPLINVWNSISLKIEEKYLGINQIVVNIKNLTLVYIKKINNLKEKLATKEAEIINLNETIENLNKKTLENQQEKIPRKPFIE